jgi:hypothetical protein
MTTQTIEPQVNWSQDQMVEVILNEPDDFLKVRETLTRIGVASRKEKKLYQSCHILHKQGRYYIVHFKELFALDGKHANLTVNDVQRRNRIVRLLADWGLITVLNQDKVSDIAPLNQIKVLAYKDKGDWILEQKYNIGKKGKVVETE